MTSAGRTRDVGGGQARAGGRAARRAPARRQRGSVLVETAITLPLVLLVAVAIFDLGRAFQTWQVLTNAAREGARMATLPGAAVPDVQTRVHDYLQSGMVANPAAVNVTVNRGATLSVNGAAVSASAVLVEYPFQFMVLGQVARLLQPAGTLGAPLTMRASAVMRNEVP